MHQKTYSPTSILEVRKNFGKQYKKCSINLVNEEFRKLRLKKFIDFYSDMSQELFHISYISFVANKYNYINKL